jgi:hypothetical protein
MRRAGFEGDLDRDILSGNPVMERALPPYTLWPNTFRQGFPHSARRVIGENMINIPLSSFMSVSRAQMTAVSSFRTSLVKMGIIRFVTLTVRELETVVR